MELLGEPLGEGLRIPCYKGLDPVRQTNCGPVRQIRGVLRVAMPQNPSKAGERLLSRSASQYQYPTSALGIVCFEAFGTRLRTNMALGVNA